MLAYAMFVPPAVPALQAILLGIAAVGFIVGIAWIRRIVKANDEPERSSFRYRRRR